MFLPGKQKDLILRELKKLGVTTEWKSSWTKDYDKNKNTAAYSDIYKAAIKTKDFFPESGKDDGVWYEVMVRRERGDYIARYTSDKLIQIIECAMRDKNIDEETIKNFITRMCFHTAYWFDANKNTGDDEPGKKLSMFKTNDIGAIYRNKDLFLALAQDKGIFTALHFYATFENYKYLRCIHKYLDMLITDRFYKYEPKKAVNYPEYIPKTAKPARPAVDKIKAEILAAVVEKNINAANFFMTAIGFKDIAPKHFALLEKFALISTSKEALREMYCVFREIDIAAGGVSAHKKMNNNIYQSDHYKWAFNNALNNINSEKANIYKRILEYRGLKPAAAIPESYTELTTDDYDIDDLAHEYFESLCEDDEDYDETGELYEFWNTEESCLIKIPAEKVSKRTADAIKRLDNDCITVTDKYYEMPVFLYVPLFINKSLNEAVLMKKSDVFRGE